MQLDFFKDVDEPVQCEDGKVCTVCGEMKDISEYYVMFTKQHKIKEGTTTVHHNKCKECYKKQANIPYHLKKTAPPPPENCDCCGKPLGDKPCLDHDHNTLEFRGWLCYSCNTGIGKLGDDPEGVRQALDYLERHYNGQP